MNIGKRLLTFIVAFALVFTMIPLGTSVPVVAASNAKIAYITKDNSDQSDGFRRSIENYTNSTFTVFKSNKHNKDWSNSDLASYNAIIVAPEISKNQVGNYNDLLTYLKSTPQTVIVGMGDLAVDLGMGTSYVTRSYGYNSRTRSNQSGNSLLSGTNYTSNSYYLTKSKHSNSVVSLKGVPSYASVVRNYDASSESVIVEYKKNESLADNSIANGDRYLIPFKDNKFDRDFEVSVKKVFRNLFTSIPDSFSVSITSQNHGQILGQSNFVFTSASDVTATVSVDSGFKLSKWTITENGSSRDLGVTETITTNVSQNATITAHIIPENALSITEFKILEVQPFFKDNGNGTYPTHELFASNFENYFQALGQNVNVTIERISIEGFNAKVDQLNGKYDMIYFGNREYYVSNDPRYSFAGTSNNGQNRHITYFSADSTESNAPTKPYRAPGNGMKDVNALEYYSPKDITNKRSAALKDFINSNHLVVFDDEIFTSAYDTTNLYKNFIDVTNSNFKRMKLDATSEYQDICLEFLSGTYSTRDTITLMSSPRAYTGLASIQDDSRWLRYNFSVASNNEDAKTIKLYLDVNGDGLYKDDELVITEDLTSPENMSIDYQLPSKFVGFLPWRLEIVNNLTNASSYINGNTAFKVADDSDDVQNIRVLQLYPGSGGLLNLQTLNNVNGENYLQEPGIYNITVDRMGMAAFDNSYDTANPKLLNGYYDMVIIGFADSVSNGGNMENPKMHAELRKFIESGQSVMLTHDMFHFYSKRAKNGDDRYAFGKEFRDLFGQNVYEYDPVKYNTEALAIAANAVDTKRLNINNDQFKIGFSDGILTRANNNQMYVTNETYKMNDGLVTMFPYNPTGLDANNADTMRVASTHTQYYQLNLENEDLVTWYTLYGNKNDQMDGQNAYYIYSVNNITYSGTGHAGGFTSAEKQLFTNTMLKAYASANHAPLTEVNNLENGKEFYRSDNEIRFSVKGIERDILDEFLKLEIYVSENSNDNFNLVQTHTIESEAFKANELKDIVLTKSTAFNQNVDTFAIKVKVSDKGGAYSEEIITDLKNISDIALGLGANWSAGNAVLLGDANTLNLTVNPLDADEIGAFANMQLVVKTPASNKSKYSDTGYAAKGWGKTEQNGYIYYRKMIGDFNYNNATSKYEASFYDNNEQINESIGFLFDRTVGSDVGFDVSLTYDKVINGTSRDGEEHITGKYVDVKQGVVNVTVRDKRGRPISNVPVKVSIDGSNTVYTQNTASDGSVSFDSINDGSRNYTISVDKPAGEYTKIEVSGTDISETDTASYTVNLDASSPIKKADFRAIYETITDKALTGQLNLVTVDNKVIATETEYFEVSFRLHKPAAQIQFNLNTNADAHLGSIFTQVPTCDLATVIVTNQGKTLTLTDSDGVLDTGNYVVRIPATVAKDTMFNEASFAITIPDIKVEEIILDAPEDQELLPETFNQTAYIVATEMKPVDPTDPTNPEEKQKFNVYFGAGATGVIEQKGVGILDIKVRPAKNVDLSDVSILFTTENIDAENNVEMNFLRIDMAETTLSNVSVLANGKGILIPQIDKRGDNDVTHTIRIEVDVTGAKYLDNFNIKFASILGVDVTTETSIPTREVKVLESLKLD